MLVTYRILIPTPPKLMTLVHINFEAVLVKVYFSGDLIERKEFIQRWDLIKSQEGCSTGNLVQKNDVSEFYICRAMESYEWALGCQFHMVMFLLTMKNWLIVQKKKDTSNTRTEFWNSLVKDGGHLIKLVHHRENHNLNQNPALASNLRHYSCFSPLSAGLKACSTKVFAELRALRIKRA